MRLKAARLEDTMPRATRQRTGSRNAAYFNAAISPDQYEVALASSSMSGIPHHPASSWTLASPPGIDDHNAFRTSAQLAAVATPGSLLPSSSSEHSPRIDLTCSEKVSSSPVVSSRSSSSSPYLHAYGVNLDSLSAKDIKKSLQPTVTDFSPHLFSLDIKSDVFSLSSDTQSPHVRRRKRKSYRRRKKHHQRSTEFFYDIVSATVNHKNNLYCCKDLVTDSSYCSRERTRISTRRGGLFFFLAMAALFAIGGSNERSHSVVNISADKQTAWLEQARIDCFEEILRVPWPDDNVTVCTRTWDLVMCWPDTKPGEVATQPCPSYVNGFQPWENATRRCMPDGTWYFDNELNRTWTNMSLCLSELFEENGSEFVKSHMGRIVFMYSLGYGISLASLGLSLFIMLYFKRLHCPRNYIHLNLFVSFILRASISFMKQKLLVAGLGFPSDVEPDEFDENKFIFKNGSTHWQCKLFFTCFNYILGANYMWILAEGIYLQLLISRAVFSEKSSVKWYMLFGWLSPLTFVVPWVIVRILEEDVYCWNTHPTVGYFWIMRGPIVLSILINFFFFLNIIRVLFTKLNAVNSPEARRFRYRKLARSTLVLIPLFGVHYMVFLVLPTNVNPTAELVQLYFEMFFNSTQGFFVAVLYCFVNGEVRNEIRKKWHRFNLMHLNHVASSRTNYSSSHTFASYLSRAPDSGRRGSRFQDSHDYHGSGRDGNGRGNGTRGRLFRENDSQHALPNQESATMLLPLKNTSVCRGDHLVKENGFSTASEAGDYSSNDILDQSDAGQHERSSFW